MSFKLYNNPKLEEFLKTEEGQNFERKPVGIHQKKLTMELSSFANSSIEGGLIVIGIENDTDVIGINSVGEKRINKLIQAYRDFCPLVNVKYKFFDIKNNKGNNDRLLLLFAEYAIDKVIKLTSGEAYERIGDQTCIMTPERIRLMEYDKKQSDFEKELTPNLTINDLDKTLLVEFVDKWVERDGLVSKPTIENLILTKNFGERNRSDIRINNAGALLFYNNPQNFISGARIRFLKYEGAEIETGTRSNIIKDKFIEGSLSNQIKEISKLIEDQLRDFSFLGKDGKFNTIPEYPKDAWLEAIVNALVHRAYYIKNSNIFIRMFDNRLEIESPGNLPGIVTIENIYEQSFSRNPALMNGFLYLGYVKQASEGLDRMKQEMLNHELPEPELKNNKGEFFFKVILKNNINKRTIKDGLEKIKGLDQNLLEKLTNDQKKIIHFLFKNKKGKTADFTDEIGKSRATAIRNLRELEKLNIIKRTKKEGPNVEYVLTLNILSQNEKQEPRIKNSSKQGKLLI